MTDDFLRTIQIVLGDRNLCPNLRASYKRAFWQIPVLPDPPQLANGAAISQIRLSIVK